MFTATHAHWLETRLWVGRCWILSYVVTCPSYDLGQVHCLFKSLVLVECCFFYLWPRDDEEPKFYRKKGPMLIRITFLHTSYIVHLTVTRKLFIFRSPHLCFFPLRLLHLLLTYCPIHISRQERKREIFLRRPISAHIRLKHFMIMAPVVVVSCPHLRSKHCLGSRGGLSSSPFAIFISISFVESGQFLLPPLHLLIAHRCASVPAGTRICQQAFLLHMGVRLSKSLIYKTLCP